jgi:hypothetical protein
MMHSPRFKIGDIIRYPYTSGNKGYYLVNGIQELVIGEEEWYDYSVIVLLENEHIHKWDRTGEEILLSMEIVDKYSTLEA